MLVSGRELPMQRFWRTKELLHIIVPNNLHKKENKKIKGHIYKWPQHALVTTEENAAG